MRRYRAGAAVRLPWPVLFHLVAARYSTTPAAVRAWPADDVLLAVALLPYTEPRGPRHE